MSKATTASRDDAPLTVLVVEDEPLIRLAISDYPRSFGRRVVEAGLADEAVTIVRVTDIAVDVVLCDMQIPGEMYGSRLAR